MKKISITTALLMLICLFIVQAAPGIVSRAPEGSVLKLDQAAIETNYINSTADGIVTLSMDVKLTNNGTVALNPGDDDYKIKLLDYSDNNKELKIIDIPEAIGIGESKTIHFDVDLNIDDLMSSYRVSEGNIYCRIDVYETISNTCDFYWITVYPYTSNVHLFPESSTDEISAPVNYGFVTENTTKKFVLKNKGAAPATITAATLPEGFTASVQTPFTINAQSYIDYEITLDTSVPGIKSGDVTFEIEDKDEPLVYKSFSGIVVGGDAYYESFEQEAIGWNLGEKWIYEDRYVDFQTDTDKKCIAQESSSADNSSKAITPKLRFAAGEKVAFQAARAYVGSYIYDQHIKVFYSTDRINWSETPLKHIKVYPSQGSDEEGFDNTYAGYSEWSDGYKYKTYVIDNIPEGEGYLAFEASGAKLDNFLGGTRVATDHDIMLKGYSIPKEGTVNNAYKAKISVQNINAIAEPAGGYRVELFVDNQVVTQAETPEIGVGETKEFELVYTPTQPGAVEIKAAFTVDNIVLESALETVNIAEETLEKNITVGNVTDIAKGAYSDGAVVNLYFKNSASVTIYPAEMLAQYGIESGCQISGFTYKGYFDNNKKFDLNIRAWVRNTNDVSPSIDAPFDMFDEANPADVTTISPLVGPMGDANNLVNLVTVKLNEPIVYTGGNLMIALESTANDWGNGYFEFDNNWSEQCIGRGNDNYDSYKSVAWKTINKIPVINFMTVLEATTLSGKVVDAITKEAIPNVDIKLTSGNVVYCGTSDSEGNYSIPVVQNNLEYTITVDEPNHKVYSEQLAFAGENIVKDIELKQFSQNREYNVTVKVTNETEESLEGKIYTLTSKLYSISYPSAETTLDAEGKSTIRVYGGMHELKVNIPGYKEAVKTFSVNKDCEIELNIEEATCTPYALNAEVLHDAYSGNNSVKLGWNIEPPVFYDDFESYDPFAITFGDWTGIDGDELAAAALQGFYPNRAVLEYAQIINPMTVEPSWWVGYPVLRPRSGRQYVGFIRTGSGEANNDWLISPQITAGNDNIVSFFAKAADVYAERFEVGVTTVENPTAADFTIVSEGNYESVGYENWRQMSYDLSEYAGQDIKIGIHYIGEANKSGAFMLMVDDFYVGQRTYAKKNAARRVAQRSPANPNETFTIYLDDVEIGQTESYNYTIENVSDGDHKLGVKANYIAAESDIIETTITVGGEYVKADFAVTTNNGESADGLTIDLTDQATAQHYAVTVAESKAQIPSLPKGTYLLSVKAEGFEAYEKTVELTADNQVAIELAELTLVPFNLSVEAQETESGVFTAEAVWNQDLGFTDSFETYPDFATEFGDWTVVDVDGNPVYPIQLGDAIVQFPGSGDAISPKPLAPIVFNPYSTVPPMLPTDVAVTAPDGDKTIAFFSAQMAQSDKWIIAPMQRIKEGYVVSALAKAYAFYPESIEFCISTTDTNAESFTVLDAVGPTQEQWTEYSIDLSEYAGRDAYVAIHYTTIDGFFTQLDQFYVGPEGNGEEANVGKVLKYEVYLDGVMLGETEQTNYTLPALSSGTHTLGVKAVYTSKTTEMAEYQFTLTSDVNTVNLTMVRIMAQQGGIIIETPIEGIAEICDMSGRMITRANVKAGINNIELAPGFYVVKLGSSIQKILVK